MIPQQQFDWIRTNCRFTASNSWFLKVCELVFMSLWGPTIGSLLCLWGPKSWSTQVWRPSWDSKCGFSVTVTIGLRLGLRSGLGIHFPWLGLGARQSIMSITCPYKIWIPVCLICCDFSERASPCEEGSCDHPGQSNHSVMAELSSSKSSLTGFMWIFPHSTAYFLLISWLFVCFVRCRMMGCGSSELQ